MLRRRYGRLDAAPRPTRASADQEPLWHSIALSRSSPCISGKWIFSAYGVQLAVQGIVVGAIAAGSFYYYSARWAAEDEAKGSADAGNPK